jgi:hypothetical protein
MVEMSFANGTAGSPQASQQPVSRVDVRPRWPARLASAALLLALGLLVSACALYLSEAAFLDHIESSVLIVGWQYLRGMPMYGIENGAPHFATYYGPLTYLAPLPALLLFGRTITAAKLVFVLAPIAATAIMALHVRRLGPASTRATLLLLIAGLLSLGIPSFWLRPDPLEMLLVTIAVALGAGGAGAMVVGLCLGLAVNLKIHAFLYFTPVLFELLQRRGWRHAGLAIAISGVVFLLPFLAHGISLTDYRFGLAQQIGARSVDRALVWSFLLWLVLLTVPLLTGLATAGPSVSRYDRQYVWAVVGTLVLLGYPATFPGAGPYHLLPLIPVVADAFGRLRPHHPVPVLVPLALLTVGLFNSSQALVTIKDVTGMNAAAQEAIRLADSNPAVVVQVGYGKSSQGYKLSQLSRTLLSLNGQPALIDGQILMELNVLGIDGSKRWVPLVGDCQVKVWLLPHDEEPFSVGSYYNDELIFPAGFRAAFHARYHRELEGSHFDLWRCNSNVGDPPKGARDQQGPN